MSTPEPPRDENPFDFSISEAIAPIRQVAENAIATQARRGSVVLFFVSGLQLVFVFLFSSTLVGAIVERNRWAEVAPNAEPTHPLVFFSCGLGAILGFTFLALGFWARKDPLLAPALGLGLFVTANLFDFILLFGFGLPLLPGGFWFWLLRMFIVVLLIDAIRAGVAYRRIVNKLIVEAAEPRGPGHARPELNPTAGSDQII
jgi:hypothetical protein